MFSVGIGENQNNANGGERNVCEVLIFSIFNLTQVWPVSHRYRHCTDCKIEATLNAKHFLCSPKHHM